MVGILVLRVLAIYENSKFSRISLYGLYFGAYGATIGLAVVTVFELQEEPSMPFDLFLFTNLLIWLGRLHYQPILRVCMVEKAPPASLGLMPPLVRSHHAIETLLMSNRLSSTSP